MKYINTYQDALKEIARLKNKYTNYWKHYDWEENDHPRGKPKNKGQFAPKNGVMSSERIADMEAIINRHGKITSGSLLRVSNSELERYVEKLNYNIDGARSRIDSLNNPKDIKKNVAEADFLKYLSSQGVELPVNDNDKANQVMMSLAETQPEILERLSSNPLYSYLKDFADNPKGYMKQYPEMKDAWCYVINDIDPHCLDYTDEKRQDAIDALEQEITDMQECAEDIKILSESKDKMIEYDLTEALTGGSGESLKDALKRLVADGDAKTLNDAVYQVARKYGISSIELGKKFKISSAYKKIREQIMLQKTDRIPRAKLVGKRTSAKKINDTLANLDCTFPAKSINDIKRVLNGIEDDRMRSLVAHIFSSIGGMKKTTDTSNSGVGAAPINLNPDMWEDEQGTTVLHELGHKIEMLYSLAGKDICEFMDRQKTFENDAVTAYARLYQLCDVSRQSRLLRDARQNPVQSPVDLEFFRSNFKYSQKGKKFRQTGGQQKFVLGATDGYVLYSKLCKGTLEITGEDGKPVKVPQMSERESTTIMDMIQAVTSYRVIGNSWGHPKPYFTDKEHGLYHCQTELIANYACTYSNGGSAIRQVFSYFCPETAKLLEQVYEGVLSTVKK